MTKYQFKIYLRFKLHQLLTDTKRISNSMFYLSMFWLVVAGVFMIRGPQWVGWISALVSFIAIIFWDINKGRHIGWQRKKF